MDTIRDKYAYVPEGTNNIAFDVHNRESKISHFFQIKVPYQITYQFCSGVEDDDYMNSITLSSDKTYYLQESYLAHNHLFHTRPQHYHDYYEFMIVLEGIVTQKIEDNEYKYPAGSCCLINRGLHHSEGFDTTSQVLFIGLSLDYIKNIFSYCEKSPYKNERSFLDSKIFHFLKSDMEHPGIHDYLDFIPAYNNTTVGSDLHRLTQNLIESILFPDLGTTYIVNGLICRMLGYLASPLKYHCSAVNLAQKNDYLLFSRIVHLMEEQNGRVTRKDLENTLNYSGDYLNRIIKKHTGMSLFDFGMSYNMKYAANCLVNTSESVSSISLKCGFSNKTHFYKCFKKIYRVTPQEYRTANK